MHTEQLDVPDSTPPATGQAASERMSARDRTVITVLLVSAFVVILNETAMNVAISRLVEDPQLGIDERLAQWPTTVFMLTMSVVIPVTGWLMQRFTTRGLFIAAMSLFSAGTLLAAIAPSFVFLLLGRVVQASGTAIVFPLLMTTVMTVVPVARRGAVMGTISLVMSVAPAMGPFVSGVILQFFSWRFVFLFVLPIAIGMLVVGARRIQNAGELTKPRLDIISVPLAALGFGGIVYALSLIGDATAPAWALPVAAAVGVGAGVAFVVRQVRLQRTDDALLDLRTFRAGLFTTAIVIMFIAMASMFGTLIMLPLILQQAMGLDPLLVGGMLLPGGLIVGLLGPVVGRLYDRHGPRVLVIPGAAVVLLALISFTTITLETPWWLVMASHMLMSLGFAFTFPPLFTVSLGALPKHLYSHGSAVLGTVQQVAGAAGTALFVTVMATQRDVLVGNGASAEAGLLGGAHVAFIGAAALWTLGVLATLRIRKPADDAGEAPIGH